MAQLYEIHCYQEDAFQYVVARTNKFSEEKVKKDFQLNEENKASFAGMQLDVMGESGVPSRFEELPRELGEDASLTRYLLNCKQFERCQSKH